MLRGSSGCIGMGPHKRASAAMSFSSGNTRRVLMSFRYRVAREQASASNAGVSFALCIVFVIEIIKKISLTQYAVNNYIVTITMWKPKLKKRKHLAAEI